MNKEEVADRIIKNIEDDILDRRSLGDALEEIDSEVRQEIRQAWREVIIKELP